LTFSSPSHLRELLDLPPDLSGFVCIQDSVEVLSFLPHFQHRPRRVLSFGCDSRLTKFSATSRGVSIRSQSFVQVTSWSLKTFRVNMEFEGAT
jgi:hypothetical protein